MEYHLRDSLQQARIMIAQRTLSVSLYRFFGIGRMYVYVHDYLCVSFCWGNPARLAAAGTWKRDDDVYIVYLYVCELYLFYAVFQCIHVYKCVDVEL